MAKRVKYEESKPARDYSDTPVSELEAALAIDENALNEALIQQPDAFYRVSKKLALKASQRDAQKQALQEEEAYADERARESIPDGERITDTAVKAIVRLDKKVLEANSLLLKLNREVGLLQALKEAFSQRSYVMKDLVSLYVANYYGDSSGGRSETHLKNKRADENRTAMGEERRRERVRREREDD